MAVRDGDIALWLHNKLGSTDDLWSGKSICSQLSREKLQSVLDCFHNLQPYVKVKLMLSFLHLPKRTIEEWKTELEDILELAINDADQWVTMVGDILRTYPSSGALNSEIDDNSPFFHEVLADLKKIVRKSTDANMLPLECLYLSKNALTSIAGHQPQPVKHFALKRKPKSAALRADLLHKSSEAAINLKKKATTCTVPIKVRSFAKNLNNTTPMKGIPSRTPTSGGFRSPTTSMSRFGGSPSLTHRSTPSSSLRKEGGIKLLDITEQPVGAKEAKRRKKIAETEALEQQKKEKEAQQSTPDYAAGLMSPAVAALPSTPTGPSYAPQPVNRLPTAAAGGSITLPTSSVSPATQQARDNLQQQLQQQLGQAHIRTQIQTPTAAQPATPTPTPPLVPTIATTPQTTTLPAPQNPPKKGLSLTREQMLEAQEMFRTSNRVTRPEKALILGFMAGSRENPCPQQGHIVNVRLSEHTDSIQQPDGLFRPMTVDTFFQMDYSTGEWKRIKKYRESDPDE